MNFFYNLVKNFFFPTISSEISFSEKQLGTFEKLLFFHDQGAFSLLFTMSLLIHLILVLTFGIISDFFASPPSPIRAKIGVSYLKAPDKPTRINRTNLNFEEPVLKKLDTDLKPKFKNLVPKKPTLKKPVLKNSLKNPKLLKPSFTETVTPKLKISKPEINNPSPSLKKNFFQKPELLNSTKKSLKKEPIYSENSNNVISLPKFKKEAVSPSTIKSSKSELNPTSIATPKFSKDDISPKKINSPKFLNNFELPTQKTPQIISPSLEEIPSISNTQSVEKSDTKLEDLFKDEIKNNEPLEDLGIPLENSSKQTKEIPDTGHLQRKKLVQLAGEEYNMHIRTQIVPKLGNFPSDLFVRIRLKIVPSGEIIDYEFINKSGFSSFDHAAELAIRNAVLDPLPKALAENPPYIVLIRIVPQN